jgi:hypothetical protein
MSGEGKEERDRRLQQAFDEAAGGLDLRLEPAGAAARCVGVAFLAAPLVAYELDDTRPPIDNTDDRAIADLIHDLETLGVHQFRAGDWRRFLNDPHIAITTTGLAEVDQTTIDEWLDSPQFREYQQEYPPKSPRDVQVENLVVVYIGDLQAAATYRVVERFANGKVTGGNASLSLARLKDIGWRGVVVNKGGRLDVPPYQYP